MSFRMAAALGAVMLAVALSAGPALAHDGHDHGAAPPPVSKSISPRGEAVSDAFELTAIPKDGKVTFYLDRFRTNEPVRGAALEVVTPATCCPRRGSPSPDRTTCWSRSRRVRWSTSSPWR
jgi:membrane fusion protein, heavy metal efflux system